MATPGDADRKPDKPPGVPGLGEHTRVTSVDAAMLGPRPSTLNDGRRAAPTPPVAIGGLVATSISALEQTLTKEGGGGSTILPNDTPYQLVRRLGSGAFGEVFEALAPGGVRVAVKRITRNVDHPASKSEKEALDAIKGLSHPFLLKTNAYWVFDDRLVIVMELADGSLADRVEHHKSQGREGAPLEELIPLFEQSAEALDYLHSQNVSHRDVKPENILVMQGYAKVADFGLARLHEHALTVVQNTVGTPAYMAPEMWKHKVSLQSDQYSLAATYVKTRLGRPLFATNVLVDMANFHINEIPNLDPLPAPEQAVLLKALAKKPEDRYPTCLAFARALRLAVFPPPPPPPVEPRREGRRALLGMGVAVAVACAVAVGVVNWATQPPRDQPKEKAAEKDKEPDKPVVVIPVVVAPEKKFVTYPEGWAPVEDAGAQLIGDKHYHNRLTRTVAGEKLAAILVFKSRSKDPESFYMLRDKITNRVFSAMWTQVKRSQASTVDDLKRVNLEFVRGTWSSGAENTEVKKGDKGHYLGIEGEQAGVPVLGVTLPEAMLVAWELGGQLPTLDQWNKAVGTLGGDNRPGPAGEALVVPPELKGPEAGKFKRDQIAARNLALGLTRGPWPVEKLTTDVSYCGIHQLASNGQEWLGQDISGQLCNLVNPPDGERKAIVIGYGPNELIVPTFRNLQTLREQSWIAVDGDSAAGFRVVLKP